MIADAGASTLTIRETQQKRWSEDGSLTVTSEPILDFVGGSKFATSAEFTVQAEGTGCKVAPVFLYPSLARHLQDLGFDSMQLLVPVHSFSELNTLRFHLQAPVGSLT